MPSSGKPAAPGDTYDLDRFLGAQQRNYAQALAEIKNGEKQSHWMWYIFPQIDGLGFSPTARHYAIKSIDEARAYLAHPVLGPRLLECAAAALAVEGKSALEIFGSPDELKLKSCATLFACAAAPDAAAPGAAAPGVASPGSVFERLLDKYFAGEPDRQTLRLLGRAV